METKLNKLLFFIIAITVVLFLSLFSMHSTMYSSSLFRVDFESEHYREADTENIADSKLPLHNQRTSSDKPAIIRTLMNSLKVLPSIKISSSSFDDINTGNNISSGGVTSAPEPVTLLLLGTGLMGIALYRRFRKR